MRLLSGLDCTRMPQHRRRIGRTNLAMCACFAALTTFCVGFAATLMSRPARTPLLTLAASYGPEWDLNAWVWEDLQQIQTLDEGTFSVEALPSIESLAGEYWDDADEMIKTALQSAPDRGPLVIYANLHGAVDDQGRACWVPPNAKANDAKTWFPIENLLEHVQRSQPINAKRPLVLILECGKLLSHAPAGFVCNDFDNSLARLIQSHDQKYPGSRLAILSSSAKGQLSHVSRRGEGDVFTRFVTEALEGAADGCFQQSREDGFVDVDELHRYVLRRTNEWSMHHRGIRQTPTSHQTSTRDPIQVSRVGSSRISPRRSRTPPPSPPQLDRLSDTLQSVADLRSEHPSEVDAYAWSQILRTAYAVEQSVFGGRAARQASDRWYNRLDRMLSHFRREMSFRDKQDSQMIDVQLNRSAVAIWDSLGKQPTRATAMDLLGALDRQEPMPVPMLMEMTRLPDTTFWRNPDLIRQTAQAQHKWLTCDLAIPDGLYHASRQIAAPVHRSRRRLADTILASRGGSLSTSDRTSAQVIADAVAEFDDQVNLSCSLLDDLCQASQVRSRAFLELPFLLAWNDLSASVHPASPDGKHSGGDKHSSLNSLMELHRCLNELATESKPWTRETQDAIVAAANRTEDLLGRLCDDFESALQMMDDLKGGDQARIAANLESAIKCQLLPNDPSRRIGAHHRLRQLEEDFERLQPMPQEKASQDKASQDKASDPFAEQQWVATLLGINEDQFDASKARRALRQIASADAQDTTISHQWRRTISLITDHGFSSVIELAKKRMQRRRVANRVVVTLDDFWHEPATGDSPYFAATSQLFMHAAESASDDSPYWRAEKRRLTQLLEARVRAVTKGVVIEALSQPSYARVNMLPHVSIAIEASQDEKDALPEGIALVSIRPQHEGDPVDYRTVRLGSELSKRQAFEMKLAASHDTPQVAEVMFRGNRYKTTIVDSATAVGTTAVGHLSPNRATVTLQNALQERRAVCFVLDCSASMNTSVDTEIARGGAIEDQGTRLDAARTAMLEMLRRLKNSGTEVGIVLYGHRVAQGAGDQGLLVQKRYHKHFPFPPTLRPFEDVEVAIPTGRFDDVQWSLAGQRFAATVPWGQTPLFLAISAAIDDIARLGPGVAKDVIVVSDGRNYQFNPSPEANIPLSKVVAKAKQKSVRVHVIAFGMDTAEAADAAAEFQAIAKGSGGQTCQDVYRATELLSELQRFAKPPTYSIELSQQTKSAPVGESIEIPGLSGTNVPIKLTIGGTSIQAPISAGSHLKLRADPLEGPPRSLVYRLGAPSFVSLVDRHGRTTSQEMAVHQPRRVGDDLHFQVSLQDRNGAVTKRPAIMWVEVRPESLNNTDEPACYRTPNVSWLNGTACPVAQIICRRWPIHADQFSVRVWVRSSAPQDVIIDSTPDAKRYQQVEGMPGVSYRAEQSEDEVELRFTYEHAKERVDSAGDSMLAVQAVGCSQAEATHWYDDARGTSVHRFVRHSERPMELHASTTESKPQWRFSVCKISSLKNDALFTPGGVHESVHTAVAHASATSYRLGSVRK